MPEQQDRKRSLILSHDSSDGIRCPICPGLIGASFQADCVCCGRHVAAASSSHSTEYSDSKAEYLSKRVKALSIIETEVELPSQEVQNSAESPQHVTRSVAAQDIQPLQNNIAPACTSRPTSSGRQYRRRSIPLLRSTYRSLDQRPGGDGVGISTTLGDGSRMIYQAQQQPQASYVVRPFPPQRGSSSRGGAKRGVNGGAHHVFKGVRTRKNVKGFLVEIRPPKWKRTIWLGTYNTSIEAAGAYDAGVFYTKKPNTKYNLQSSLGAFPPLPSHLHLDSADSMDEIKLFVQNQAREAARRAGNAATTAMTTTNSQPSTRRHSLEAGPADHIVHTSSRRLHESTSSEACITGDSSTVFTRLNANDHQVSTMSNSPSDSSQVDIDSEFQIPLDMVYLAEESARYMFLDYANYESQQGDAGPDQQLVSMSEGEGKDEEDVEFTTS